MNIKKYIKLLAVALPLACASCQDMLDTDSTMVQYSEDNLLNTPQDTLHSVMGIIRQMQVIADRNVILGELRADLVSVTPKASTDLKNIAAHNLADDNQYNKIVDYYAVINNCNFFIAHADTTLSRYSHNIFKREYAAVKAYRAWTYLQMAKLYGQVPLVLTPVLTEAEAQAEQNKARAGINEICNFFIDDLKPYLDTDKPQYGAVNGFESEGFFIPVRVLVGEMCLWAGRYQEAAQYLYEYITDKRGNLITGVQRQRWNVSNLDFTTATVSSTIASQFLTLPSTEILSYIPMETSEFYGVKSMLENVYASTLNNNYYYQATASPALKNLSRQQTYVMLAQTSDTQKDTVYVPKTNLRKDYMAGDLRLCGTYSLNNVNRDATSDYSSEIQSINKLVSQFVTTYRRSYVYLLFAEALCRAGYPESAFCVLKYGLCSKNIEKYISQQEKERAGSLLTFPTNLFPEEGTMGIHSRGCGNVECDSLYRIPDPQTTLASYDDTLQYRIPLVEDMIINEMALETAFEGYRFYDLMRIAIRRSDNAYLAKPVAMRSGLLDETLYQKLMDRNNWYLPIK